MDFEVGDKVIVSNPLYEDNGMDYLNCIGTVRNTSYQLTYPIEVSLLLQRHSSGDFYIHNLPFKPEELTKIDPNYVTPDYFRDVADRLERGEVIMSFFSEAKMDTRAITMFILEPSQGGSQGQG